MIEKRGVFDGLDQRHPVPGELRPADLVEGIGYLIAGLIGFVLAVVVGLAGLVFVIWLIKTIWRAV